MPRAEQAVVEVDEARALANRGAVEELQGGDCRAVARFDLGHAAHLHALQLDGVVLHESADGGKGDLDAVVREENAVAQQGYHRQQRGQHGQGHGVSGESGVSFHQAPEFR
jgi:hypothetical protein